MAYELENGRGSLWPNDKKGVDSRPDKQGKIKIDGKEYYISSWNETSSKGVPYDSIRIKPVEESEAPKQEAPPQTYGEKDEIPF